MAGMIGIVTDLRAMQQRLQGELDKVREINKGLAENTKAALDAGLQDTANTLGGAVAMAALLERAVETAFNMVEPTANHCEEIINGDR